MEALLNDPRINQSVYRTRVRKILASKFKLSHDEIMKLVPKMFGNRFQQGIVRSLKDRAIDVYNSEGTDAAIKYIINNTYSNLSAMNNISFLKSYLLNKGIDVSDINNNMDRLNNQEIAVAIQERNRENKLFNDPFVVHPNFSYDNVLGRLAIYLNSDIKKEDEFQFLADMLIAFAARPSELYKLRFVGDKITGQLKSRGNQEPLKYAGMYSIPKAKLILEKLPSDSDLSLAKNYKRFIRYLSKFNMNPRSLRTLGAEYITKAYKPEERRKVRQLALRHKDLGTSLISYQMPLNVTRP